MRTYTDLFRVRDFRTLWTASALVTAASTMASLALATLVHAQTGSALLTAVALFGPSLAQAVGAMTLMSAADTARPRPLLTLLSGITAATLLLQAAFALPPTGRIALVLVASYLLSIGAGVRWGLLATILPRDGYALGRSAMNVSVGVMQVVGFATGGVLLQALDVRQIFAVAASVALLAVPLLRLGLADHPARRVGRPGLRETWRANAVLLRLPSTRPLLLALCIPNGLVVGCEALFVPYAGEAAAPLFVAAAVGMLCGDLAVGRLLSARGRQRAAQWLRLLLAAPFLLFVLEPSVAVAVLLTTVATVGYAASLAQQELLVALTPPDLSGQVLGVESSARTTCQGLGAILAGLLGDAMGAAGAIAVLALLSLVVSAALTPALGTAAARVRHPAGAPPAG